MSLNTGLMVSFLSTNLVVYNYTVVTIIKIFVHSTLKQVKQAAWTLLKDEKKKKRR